MNSQKLVYNYTTSDFMVTHYPDDFGSKPPLHMFHSFVDADTEELKPPFLNEGDDYAVYDISHWDLSDVVAFFEDNEEKREYILRQFVVEVK